MKKILFSALSGAQATALFLGDKKMSVQDINNNILLPHGAIWMLDVNDKGKPICPVCLEKDPEDKVELKALIKGTNGLQSLCCPKGHYHFSVRRGFKVEYRALIKNPHSDWEERKETKWVYGTREGSPYSVNDCSLPGVMYLTWKFVKSKKDNTRLITLDWDKRETAPDRTKLMKEAGLDMELTDFTDLCRMITTMINKWGHDFLGRIPIPDELWEGPEVETTTTAVPTISWESDKDFLSEKDVKHWFETYRRKDPVRAFPPKGFEDFLLMETDNPGVSHLLMEIFQIVNYLKGFNPNPLGGSAMLGAFIDHGRAWNNFNYAIHLYCIDPEGSKKAILSALETQATPKELRVFLIRDKDLLKILKEGPQNGEVFFTVEGFRKVVREKFHYDMSPRAVKEFFQDYLEKL